MPGKTVRVKICGISDLETALVAVEAGADALGFVFAPSRRRVTPGQARNIIAKLPPFVDRVGVFVNTPAREVADIADYCGLTAVQICGYEPLDYDINRALPVIRTLRVGTVYPVPDLAIYRAHAFLFDTFQAGSYGGTGKTFDWRILEKLDCPRPVILAGGLNAANVQEAIRLIQPYAVDVSGGVETRGQKDHRKIEKFIQLAKEALI